MYTIYKMLNNLNPWKTPYGIVAGNKRIYKQHYFTDV